MFRKDRYPNWAPIVCEECSFYFENGDKWAKYTSGVCQVKPLSLQKSEKSRQVSVGHGQSYYLASEQGEELDDLLLFIPPLHLRKKKKHFIFFSLAARHLFCIFSSSDAHASSIACKKLFQFIFQLGAELFQSSQPSHSSCRNTRVNSCRASGFSQNRQWVHRGWPQRLKVNK